MRNDTYYKALVEGGRGRDARDARREARRGEHDWSHATREHYDGEESMEARAFHCSWFGAAQAAAMRSEARVTWERCMYCDGKVAINDDQDCEAGPGCTGTSYRRVRCPHQLPNYTAFRPGLGQASVVIAAVDAAAAPPREPNAKRQHGSTPTEAMAAAPPLVDKGWHHVDGLAGHVRGRLRHRCTVRWLALLLPTCCE